MQGARETEMKLLAMDTSTAMMGIAVMDLEHVQILGETTIHLHRNHSVRFMPAMEHLLHELELTMADIHVLAVTAGPGSYTGIRIGVTIAKTISWARQLPLYSESSLTVLAMNGLRFTGIVVPLLDARRRRVYSGVYEHDGGKMVEVCPQQVVEIERWLEQISQYPQSVLFLGNDVVHFRAEIEQRLGKQAQFGTVAENVPQPSQLAMLAWKKWADHEPPEHTDFAPRYLQLAEAEANWRKQQAHGEKQNG
jgi:tRNA threonylcarbamoyladenosine biosynthesis protein TsaB